LETGAAGVSGESLAGIAGEFRSLREEVDADSRHIFSSAATMAEVLEEALADRGRHLEKLAKIGGGGDAPASETGRDVMSADEKRRKHLELAVSVSWQRNSGAYRDRIEELWGRLEAREYGRFRGRTPASTPAGETNHETH
jgi:hypothetical protein